MCSSTSSFRRSRSRVRRYSTNFVKVAGVVAWGLLARDRSSLIRQHVTRVLDDGEVDLAVAGFDVVVVGGRRRGSAPRARPGVRGARAGSARRVPVRDHAIVDRHDPEIDEVIGGGHHEMAQLVDGDAEVLDLLTVEARLALRRRPRRDVPSGDTPTTAARRGARYPCSPTAPGAHARPSCQSLLWSAAVVEAGLLGERARGHRPVGAGCPHRGATKHRSLRMLRRMDGPPQITITFPGTPEFLRLARLTSADAGSRAGFDYEDIDDLRIAVSELCSLISGAPGGEITLEFHVEPGSRRGRRPRRSRSPRRKRFLADDRRRGRRRSRAASDDGTSVFRCTKRAQHAGAETLEARPTNDGDAGRSPRRLSVCREGPAQ